MKDRCPNCKRAMPRPIPVRRSKARRGPLRLPTYRRWLKQQPCAICALLAHNPEASRTDFEGCFLVDPAHTQNNGLSSKGPDSSCVPLGRKHHQEFDSNRAAFEKKYGVNMAELAKQCYLQFLLETAALDQNRRAA